MGRMSIRMFYASRKDGFFSPSSLEVTTTCLTLFLLLCFGSIVEKTVAFTTPTTPSVVVHPSRTTTTRSSTNRSSSSTTTTTTLFMSATLNRPPSSGTSPNPTTTTPRPAATLHTTASSAAAAAAPVNLGNRMGRDYCCQILGVPRHATDDQIKKAYRRLAKMYHPGTVRLLVSHRFLLVEV